MLNCWASLVKSTSSLKALPGELEIKSHLPSILYLLVLNEIGTGCTSQAQSFSSTLCTTCQLLINFANNLNLDQDQQKVNFEKSLPATTKA